MAEGNLKITLVGLGNAGRAVVGMLLATRGRFDINIQDPSEAIEGTILDLKHAAGTNGRNRIFWNDREQFESSDFVVHTAGGQIHDGGDRMAVSGASIEMARKVFEGVQFRSEPYILVVANPIDVVAYFVQKFTGISPEKIIGIGTAADTARLQYSISEFLGLEMDQVSTMALGEHGMHLVPIWSHTTAGGKNIEDLIDEAKRSELKEQTIHSPQKIRTATSASVFPTSLLCIRIIRLLDMKEEGVLPLSTSLNSENQMLFETEAIYMSVPVKISGGSLEQVKGFKYSADEIAGLKNSADIIRHSIQLYSRYYKAV